MKRSSAIILAGLLSLSLFAGSLSGSGEGLFHMFHKTSQASTDPVSVSGGEDTTECTLILTLADDISCEQFEASEGYSAIAARAGLETIYSDHPFLMTSFRGNSVEASRLTAELAGLPFVMSAEQDTPIALSSISDDQYSDSQWSLNNIGIYSHIEGSTSGNILTTPDIDIDAPEGWSQYRSMHDGSKVPVTVAVIDTGIDWQHPDLSGAMWVNTGEIDGNGIDDDGNGYVDDIYGWDFYNNDATVCHYDYNAVYDTYLSNAGDCDDHGTHVAGIIAATSGNTIGIAGVASCADVKLMSLKINGGSNRSGNASDAIKAIRYADRMGAKLCNLSWGSYVGSTALYTAIERSHMLFICAAGNSGTDNDKRPMYPACYDLSNIISVTHIDAGGNLTYDSNYGVSSVDVAVPATDIYSTFVGTYSSLSGSSMATAHVTGIAAVIYTLGSGLYPAEVKELITSTVKPLDSLQGFVKYPGIPDLYRSLASAWKLIYDKEAPSFSVERGFSGENLLLTFTASDAGGSGTHFMRYIIGPKKADDFCLGTAGTVITGNSLEITKSGLYTFYLSDNAGNETVRTTYIMDDVLPPVFSGTAYSVNNKMTRLTLSCTVSDADSGVKTVKFLPGKHSIADFAENGTVLTLGTRNRISFSTNDEGTYTIYACDRRGNESVTYIYAYIRHSTAITTDTEELFLGVGDAYTLITVLTPEKTTDKLTFRSSDISVATVSSKGVIRAVAEGTAIITVTTSSGLKAVCSVTVGLPSDTENEDDSELTVDDIQADDSASPDNVNVSGSGSILGGVTDDEN